MKTIDWKEMLGWTDEQFEEIRNAGYSYIRQGKYDIALAFFKALVAVDPDNAYDNQTLGALYLEMGQTEEAIKFLNQALILDADHAPTLLNLTKAMFMAGKKQEAMQLAKMLQDDTNPHVSSMAKALLLAYG